MDEDILLAVASIAFVFVILVTTGQVEVLGLFSPPTLGELQ